MKIVFNTMELENARGVLAFALPKQNGALHLVSHKGQTKIVVYDDKNMQVSQYLEKAEVPSGDVDKWLDKSFLDIVKAYAGCGCESIVMEYDDADDGGTISLSDENGDNMFKIAERQACKMLDENAVMSKAQPEAMVAFEAEDLSAAMDIYGYPASGDFDGVLITEEERGEGSALFSTRALSGHRVAKGFVSAISVSGNNAEFTLTPEIRGVLKSMSGRVDIGIFEKCLILKTGTIFVISVNKQAKMPAETVDQLISAVENTAYGFGVSAEKFQAAVNMATAIGEKREKVLIFSYEKDGLYLLQKDQSAKVKLEVAKMFHEEHFQSFALKPEYILDMLKSVMATGATMIAVGIVNPQQPVYFTPSAAEGEKAGVHIILPVNIG